MGRGKSPCKADLGTDMDLAGSTAIEMRDAIIAKKVSPVEVVNAAIERQGAVEPVLNSFVTATPEVALAAAKRAEQAIMSGAKPGVLAGLPISVKDTIAVAGVPLTLGSRLFEKNIAVDDVPSIERLRAAGASILGKTTSPEFGMKVVGSSPLSGVTRNPWNTGLTPGGSSAGAASSVASGVTPFAIGTDAGGSIRIPAAFTGLFGIKAQFGRIPVYPVGLGTTLGHVAILSRTVRDSAFLLQEIAGPDRRDPHSVLEPNPDFLGACDQGVKGLRVAWSPTLGFAKPDSEVVSVAARAAKILERL
ncbi:MAG TPA: amidase family protein, partial [Terriglobales bacterium]|nr:amidase family protein [Terriglobales bacterium]